MTPAVIMKRRSTTTTLNPPKMERSKEDSLLDADVLKGIQA